MENLNFDAFFNFETCETPAPATLRGYQTHLSDAPQIGSAKADSLIGSKGDDVLVGLAGDDILRGLSGNDQLYGDEHSEWYLPTQSAGADVLRGGGGDDQLFGGNGADRLFGATGNDTLYGGQQRDVLTGGSGNDQIFGGNAKDRLFGGAGNDTLSGGKGRDKLFGGEGADVFSFFQDQKETIMDFEDDIDTIQIVSLGHGGGLREVRKFLNDFARVDGDDILIEHLTTIRIKGFSDIAALANDIECCDLA